MKIRAMEIQYLPAGSRVVLDNTEWIRMEDCRRHHIDGYVFNPTNGDFGHWSMLCSIFDDIELTHRADGPNQGESE
jgi:hypothetical protein